MAFLLPWIHPIITGFGIYKATTETASAVTDVTTKAIDPVLTNLVVKVSQSIILYSGSKMLDWACSDAAEFLRKYCENHGITDLGCMANQGKKITSCTGSWVLSGAIFYEGYKTIIGTPTPISTQV